MTRNNYIKENYIDRQHVIWNIMIEDHDKEYYMIIITVT